jgi:cell division septation protein DedD
MRALFLLLVLANLFFYAYAQVAREPGSAEKQIPLLQIAPEKIKLLNAGGKPPPEKKQAPRKSIPPAPPKVATVAPGACLEWGIFAGPGVAKAEAALAKLELPEDRIERTVTDAGGYWVYIPPLKNKAEADRKVRELQGLGITEFFVVQDSGQWRYAISLGIFRSDEAAQTFLAKLRQQKVRSAIAARRENFLRQVAFYLREPGEATVARLTLIQQDFPDTDLKAGPCPTAQSTSG